MNCENYLSLIGDLVEKKLDEPTSQTVLSHLISCQSCENVFEIQFAEKEICTDFFSEIKPINDLPNEFRNKLKTEKITNNSPISTRFIFIDSLKNSLKFPAFQPILAGAIILLMIGFVYFVSKNEKEIVSHPAKTNDFSSANTDTKLIAENESKNNQPIIENDLKFPTKKVRTEPKSFSIVETGGIDVKPKSVKTISKSAKKPIISQENNQNAGSFSKSHSKEIVQIQEIQSFKVNAGKQMEKVEMLFRSFRNARIVEGSDSFDISYESQQARKLLENNIHLRKTAENFRSFEIEEVFETTESLLLDIAKLDKNSSREQVIKIKNRLNNQNIIASLQIY